MIRLPDPRTDRSAAADPFLVAALSMDMSRDGVAAAPAYRRVPAGDRATSKGLLR